MSEPVTSHNLAPVDNEQHNIDFHDPANITNPEHVAHHIVSPAVYGMIFGVLMIGTLATVGASMLPLGIFNAPIAIAIACTKAVFVVLFFMHVKYSSRLVKLTVSAGFFTFFVLVMMCMLDYFTRAWGQW
ncbi:caa(3)-type oxidase, subunit IV [Terriglobus roseus DSM 18391]|uniref:Caa(3)-type oxidase, subunit IV n=1 Tax=Terriglobus roseus (strain DSM 18391 / NRRL B-41598 / KBS 63) TaxID=926566 RepID=I3ZBM5_TERRK|nr:cytochrome C oxidase subunit IV family protein [Terriglobus roseus]AFL86643.1 caa(3)-type oxidase, subunit IV [Terriglobus roseus DSM 18391]